jgi:hypothetical protein
MLHPQEVEVWYVLPTIRKEMCRQLKKELTQKQIADMLGITEAAVSQYTGSKRAAKVKFSGQFNDELKRVCKQIAARKIDPFAGVQRLCRQLYKTGEICKVHKKIENVRACCDVCFR